MSDGQHPFVRDAPDAAAYVRAWKRGKAITAAGGLIRMEWCGRDLNADLFNREMRGALDRRINLRGGFASDGRPHNGRRTAPQYQVELERDARELNRHASTRIRLWGLNGRRWRTDIVQRRFGHLLSETASY